MKKIYIGYDDFALVDDADFGALSKHKWYLLNNHGRGCYAARNEIVDGKNTTTLMHREITMAVKGVLVDHKNGNSLDNRRENLRLCTNAENVRNSKVYSNNTTGFKGVVRRRNRFKAQITVNRKTMSIGYFDTAEDAYEAYKEKAKLYFGEFAKI